MLNVCNQKVLSSTFICDRLWEKGPYCVICISCARVTVHEIRIRMELAIALSIPKVPV